MPEHATDYYPIIFIRGFDPLGGSVRDPFTGFNDGTSYVRVQDHERDFPGFVISFLQDKTHPYRDTINILRFREASRFKSAELGIDYEDCCFTSVLDDTLGLMAERYPVVDGADLRLRTFWVFNFYAGLQGSLYKRRKVHAVPYFARELERYIHVVRKLTGANRVNLIAHSMGGVIIRHLVQRRYYSNQAAKEGVNRIVTLGSPLAGITYLGNALSNIAQPLLGLADAGELSAMDPDLMCEKTLDDGKPRDGLHTAKGRELFGLADPSLEDREDRMESLHEIGYGFRAGDWLCIGGTDHRDYAFSGGRAGSLLRGGGANDGLVQLKNAYFQDSPRAFFHKPHGGVDSLITCRESFEAATRFLFAGHRVRISIRPGSKVLNFNPECNYYLGCTVKVRDLDFVLNERSYRAGNTFVLFKAREDRKRWLTYTKHSKSAKFAVSDQNDNLAVFEGFLDIQRSADGGESIMFRIDLEIIAETLPARFLGINLGHSDMKVMSEQFYFEYRLDSGQLLLHGRGGHAISAEPQRDDTLEAAIHIEGSKTGDGVLRFSLPGDIDAGSFSGGLVVDVWKR